MKHILVLGSVLVSLLLMEVVLRMMGRYDDLVRSGGLVPSPAIWERPSNTTQKRRHAVTGAKINTIFDGVGVRNHSSTETVDKHNIIGFFGDSFTENRRIEDRFSVTSVLQVAVDDGVSVVNFGIDGYGLAQSYIRYLKFKDLEIRHVVYVFCSNDFRNLYETQLTRMSPDGAIEFREPKTNHLARMAGRFRLTYLLAESWLVTRALLARQHSPSDDEVGGRRAIDPSSLRGTKRRRPPGLLRLLPERLHDPYADSMNTGLLSDDPSPETVAYAELFRRVLDAWHAEVTGRKRRFTIVVLPRKVDTDAARALFGTADYDTIYLEGELNPYERHSLPGDGHWNERGNVKAARLMARHPSFQWAIVHPGPERISYKGYEIEIKHFYSMPGS